MSLFPLFPPPQSTMSTVQFSQGVSRAMVGEMALKALTHDLSGPIPSCCAIIVSGAITLLAKNPPDTEAEMATDSNYPERLDRALDVLSRWSSFRRTRAQVETVLSLSCTCSPQDAASDLHQVGVLAQERGVNMGPGRTSGVFLIHFSMEVLRNAHEKRRGDKLLHHLARRKQWPYTTEKTMPHGPSSSIAGYLDWMVTNDILIYRKILDLLTWQMDYGWTLIAQPSIKEHLFLSQFIDGTARWCSHASKIERGDIRDHTNFRAATIVGIFLLMSVSMWTITSGCSDHTAATFFLRERHQDVLIACDRMMATSPILSRRVRTPEVTAESKQIVEYLRLVGTTIYNLFPESCPRMSLVSLESRRLFMRDALSLMIPHILPWARFVDNLNYRHIRQRCSAPGCNLTPELRKLAFRYCTGCGRIPYCSRACQKQAWRSKDNAGQRKLPEHRDVCGLIRDICSRYNVPRLDLSKLRNGEIPCVPAPVLSEKEMQSVGAINDHFAALTTHQLQS
jgi:ferredoxin